MKYALTYGLLFLSGALRAQLSMEVNVSVGNQPVQSNEPVTVNGTEIRLEQVKFYLSEVRFYSKNELVQTDSVQAYLIDLEMDTTMKIVFPYVHPQEVDEVRFLFGIDSTLNTSGAMGGALDPMYGMYWSWQSGYINCKLEGTVKTPQEKAFQLHLGGYTAPFLAAREVRLNTTSSNTLHVNVDLSPVLNQLLSQEALLHVMSPGINAVNYAELLSNAISSLP